MNNDLGYQIDHQIDHQLHQNNHGGEADDDHISVWRRSVLKV